LIDGDVEVVGGKRHRQDAGPHWYSLSRSAAPVFRCTARAGQQVARIGAHRSAVSRNPTKRSRQDRGQSCFDGAHGFCRRARYDRHRIALQLSSNCRAASR